MKKRFQLSWMVLVSYVEATASAEVYRPEQRGEVIYFLNKNEHFRNGI